MAIKHIAGTQKTKRNLVFKKHQLALAWCKGTGIELGAAAHNPFHLAGSINVAPEDDFEFFKSAQVDMCGSYAAIDVHAEAHALPFDAGSQDYVISSHVVEHLPNPIAAFLEWNRVLKPGGIIFMVIPLPDAHPADVGRPLATIEELETAYSEGYTVETFPDKSIARRGHYYVYTCDTMVQLIQHCNLNHSLDWEIVATEAKDTKVGNGFTLVARYMPDTEHQQEQPVHGEDIQSEEADVEKSVVSTTDGIGGDIQGQDINPRSSEGKTSRRKRKTAPQS